MDRVEKIEQQMERLLRSVQLREAPRLQALLRFLLSAAMAGRADEIKEATLAREVFGRADTTGDSIVRSSAGRLRARLEEYYAGDGREDAIRISIPKGAYVPLIESRMRQEAAATLPEVHSRHRYAVPLAAASILILLATVSVLSLLHGRAFGSERHQDPAAHDLYLQGRYYWEKRTPEDLNRAIDFFTRSVVRDPHNAEAFTGLADAYNLLSEYSGASYRESFQRAAEAAQEALALDPGSADAHNALAFASFYGNWDAARAEHEFRRALELNPRHVTAHHWYATFLVTTGRPQQALGEIDKARELDPSSRSILADKAFIMARSGQVGEAERLLLQLEANDEKFVSPHRYLAGLYLGRRQYGNFLTEIQSVAALTGNERLTNMARAGERAFATHGASAMLQAMMAADPSGDEGEGSYMMAGLCVELDRYDGALELLRSAYARHDVNMVALRTDTSFAPLHRLPEFCCSSMKMSPR